MAINTLKYVRQKKYIKNVILSERYIFKISQYCYSCGWWLFILGSLQSNFRNIAIKSNVFIMQTKYNSPFPRKEEPRRDRKTSRNPFTTSVRPASIWAPPKRNPRPQNEAERALDRRHRPNGARRHRGLSHRYRGWNHRPLQNRRRRRIEVLNECSRQPELGKYYEGNIVLGRFRGLSIQWIGLFLWG